MMKNISPVLTWAGRKTQIIDKIIDNMPKYYINYYEPFVGSAAVLLAIKPSVCFINDTNKQLMNLYLQIKNNVYNVISYIKELDKYKCTKDMYYSIRERYNNKIKNEQLDTECAALMVWINKHCFNGLYRVNSKGLFNVPYNNKIYGKSIDEDNIINMHNFFNLSNIEMTCCDFEEVCKNANKDDFIYFDSPYATGGDIANFTDYTMDGFSIYDHRRLANLFKDLDKIGVKLMLSNSNTDFIYSLYDGFNIQEFDVMRKINRNSYNRYGKEVIITNY